MNKIIYTLGFLLFFSLFNNNAKAQTAGDVAACPKNGSGQITISNILGDGVDADDDQTCDGEGATNVTLNIYSLGFCTSEPKVRFASNAARLTDQRDKTNTSYYTNGTSDFSSCTWTIKGSSTFSESLEGVGDIEPLPNDEIPPAGTYTHAVVVVSNELQITGTANFSGTIIDSTGTGELVTSGNSGTKCWTNGTFFIDTGQQGPLIGTSTANAVVNKGLGRVRGGATCGSTPSPLANTIKYYYGDVEGFGNTTRSEESTAFGTLSVLYTNATLESLATNSPVITRPAINSEDDYGTATETNTLTLVFAYNTPMVVTDKTTGMDIFLNFSNALSLDFEPTSMSSTTTSGNRDDGKVNFTVSGTTTTPTSAPRIRAIQSGPFGIQFKAIEGGGIN
jgi:hypothetical protein